MSPSESKAQSIPHSSSTQELLNHGNKVWGKKRLEKKKNGKQIVFDESERNKFICSFPFRNVEKKKKEAIKKEKKRKQERNKQIAMKRKQLADHYSKMMSEKQSLEEKARNIEEKKTLFTNGNTVTTVTISETIPPLL